MSLLVYTHKITPRFQYIFRQVFEGILKIPVTFTTTLETFVANSGPKFSYSQDQLGQEFHVYATPLLWEQGIQDISLDNGNWKGLPVLFHHRKESQIPFDLFAASFYCLSRYEEYLPHLQDDLGRFGSHQSWAASVEALELPLVDLWAVAFLEELQKTFPELSRRTTQNRPKIQPIFDVVHPLKYRYKSFISGVRQWGQAWWQLNLWDVLEHLLVAFRILPDPYDTYDDFLRQMRRYPYQLMFFVSFAQKSFDGIALRIHSHRFQSLIKSLSDDFTTALLVSHHGQLLQDDMAAERADLEATIHRPIQSTRFNKGLFDISKSYNPLIRLEVARDYSMGYPDQIGYRASTSVPFFFYDLQNEYQTPLQLFPVVASEEQLRKFSSQIAFEKLTELLDGIPTATGVQRVAFRNTIWDERIDNQLWRKAFFQYLEAHAERE